MKKSGITQRQDQNLSYVLSIGPSNGLAWLTAEGFSYEVCFFFPVLFSYHSYYGFASSQPSSCIAHVIRRTQSVDDEGV